MPFAEQCHPWVQCGWHQGLGETFVEKPDISSATL
jgi:hypothetical protein